MTTDKALTGTKVLKFEPAVTLSAQLVKLFITNIGVTVPPLRRSKLFLEKYVGCPAMHVHWVSRVASSFYLANKGSGSFELFLIKL